MRHASFGHLQNSQNGPSLAFHRCAFCAYLAHQLIRDACFSTDGLLSVAVGWLLRRQGIAFFSGSYADVQELDYRFEHSGRAVLLECKMHKTHKNEESTERHLASDVTQAIRHSDEIKARGERLDAVWIVTNYDPAVIDPIIQRIRTRETARLVGHTIEFVDPKSLAVRGS